MTQMMTESKTTCQTRNLIAGQWVNADSGEEIDVTNPATDEGIARVPDCGKAETRRAIEAARAALDDWRARTADDRGRMLRRFAELMLRDRDRLARIMTIEQGKPFAEAAGEINYAASFLDWAADEGKRIYGETVPANAPDKRILVIRQPVGVCCAITPWNFPSAMITRKLGPALAAGCTMVVKPAELTPLSAIALGELAQEAGLPDGVFNIVTGDAKAIGEEMLSNQTVRKLSFTGSTPVGKLLMKQAAENVTRLSLELGGHAPLIVFDDADLDVAVAGAMGSKFRNAGQTCVCANRLYIHEKIYDAFAERFTREAEQLKVGIGTEDDVKIGPLINNAAMEKVEKHVTDAVDRGARIRTGGRRVTVDGAADRFYAPTVLDDVTDDMLISCEETFGPVAPLLRFRDEDEVIERANNSPFGLASYFFTRDASRLMRVAEALDYGIVGANDGLPSTAQAPFGGVKQSGIGREGGRYVMAEYLETKYISMKI